MSKINLLLQNGNNVVVDRGTTVSDIISKFKLEGDIPPILGKVNNNYLELSSEVTESGTFEVVDIRNSIGMKAYVRTLQFILIKAVYDLFPNARISIEHTISKGLFGEIHKEPALDSEDIIKIKARMTEIINRNLPINKLYVNKEEAVMIFEGYGLSDKVRLLKHIDIQRLKLYELDGRYDYFYGFMADSTGIANIFDIIYYEPGFLLRFPTEANPNEIPPLVERKKLAKIFYETEQWGNILGVGDVGSLNDKVESGEIIDIIRVAEALHEKKIANIADMINDRKEVKVVLIAGPSSSGKTTFSKRLGIQLRVNGHIPIPISLDDYFVDREHTPLDEDGKPDFESLYALDLDLFNKHLVYLLEGKEIEIPTFNFKTGKREWNGQKLSLPKNGVLVIEGIHGLNDLLTSTVPAENKFKIYISALTQLNLDDHNRIATTDVRIIRRIVRDFLSRGYGGEQTLMMWPSIRRGEEKNIFVFQEESDVMFNSTLVYELCVLKKFAMEELSKIKNDSPVYYEACKLKSFLSFFKEVDTSLVPENSILREFIGGSCFYKY
ncbi:nucleoside kinase [Clostridium thermarum]|uniref:nucleoside kinase n=1 Tax=Clostridium thermarum TaxID=1716543 RepID=UPI0013D18955|nr:nucleoside kinase [Clostridium thermarum]